MRRAVLCGLFFMSLVAQGEPIEDNSFLVEEAYNQEAGVVQFISVWQKQGKSNDWSYTFINEIPVVSQAHQFSYEVPISHVSNDNIVRGGDIKFNYRYEFQRSDVVVATGRLSAAAPTGDYKSGAGQGSTSYEASLISSIKIGSSWVQHWNLGAGITPKNKLPNDVTSGTSKYFVGLSNVYLFSDNLNFMLEFLGTISEETIGMDLNEWGSAFLLSPSLRYAIDIENWQIVPGIAFPVGLGPSAGENQFLGYLSIEGLMW